MSNFYYIIITLAVCATVSCFCAIKVPEADAKTENEKSFKFYLMFMFGLFYILLYYWLFPRNSVGIFVIYLLCAFDLIDNSTRIVYNLVYGKKDKSVKKTKRK